MAIQSQDMLVMRALEKLGAKHRPIFQIKRHMGLLRQAGIERVGVLLRRIDRFQLRQPLRVHHLHRFVLRRRISGA